MHSAAVAASPNSKGPSTAGGGAAAGGVKRLAPEPAVPGTETSASQTNPNKRQRVSRSTLTLPATLPMQPHEELLQELKGRYSVATASVIGSSKINKKVTQVLSHLGHVDLFSQSSVPGVMMLHARASDANKMVTVLEISKRKMSEAGQPWYQYNRVYEVADGRGSERRASGGEAADQTFIEDTVLESGGADADDDEDDEEEDVFEPVGTVFERAVREKPAEESKTTYMSIFLSRVPMPELQSKAYMTLQTNGDEIDRARRS